MVPVLVPVLPAFWVADLVFAALAAFAAFAALAAFASAATFAAAFAAAAWAARAFAPLVFVGWTAAAPANDEVAVVEDLPWPCARWVG